MTKKMETTDTTKTEAKTLVLRGRGVKKISSSPANVLWFLFTAKLLKKANYSPSPLLLELSVNVTDDFHVTKFNGQFLLLSL